MFLFVVVFSIGVALLRGGRVERLADFPFRHVWLVFAAFGVQLFLRPPVAGGDMEWVRAAAPYVYPSAYYMLLLCFLLNRRAPGAGWLAGGALANLAVITANGGKMPVDGEILLRLGQVEIYEALASGRSLTHELLTSQSRLPWLADCLKGTPPFPNPSVFSVGDVLLAVGVFILVQATMVARPGAVRQ